MMIMMIVLIMMIIMIVMIMMILMIVMIMLIMTQQWKDVTAEQSLQSPPDKLQLAQTAQQCHNTTIVTDDHCDAFLHHV